MFQCGGYTCGHWRPGNNFRSPIEILSLPLKQGLALAMSSSARHWLKIKSCRDVLISFPVTRITNAWHLYLGSGDQILVLLHAGASTLTNDLAYSLGFDIYIWGLCLLSLEGNKEPKASFLTYLKQTLRITAESQR